MALGNRFVDERPHHRRHVGADAIHAPAREAPCNVTVVHRPGDDSAPVGMDGVDELAVDQLPMLPQIASVGVVRMDLDEIVVQSTRDLEFSFLVNGVRRSQKDRIGPIVENTFEYVPRSAEEKMPGYLSQDQKQVLIRNGTYRPDGTVNLETARQLGWDRIWAQRERPSRRLASE